MDDIVTAKLLFQRYHKRLDLQWLAGHEGEQRALGQDDDASGHSQIGYLNIIHPNRVQLLGPLEFDYLNGLDAVSRQQLIEQLCASKPAVVIVTDAQPVPDELRKCCEQSQTPLLLSGFTGSNLLKSLRHYLDDELAEKSVVHGVFLEVHGMGVLLTGESSVGKSELALELITRNHRLIADDAPEFFRVGPDTVRGRCPAMLRDFLEVRGLGVLNVRAMYGDSAIKMSKDLRLIVHLQRLAAEALQQVDRLQGSYRQRTILDVGIPEVTLPVASGRNLAVLVEAAVRDHILLRKGYNASEAFSQRQRELMQSQTKKE
jgi:HPr kinase/phosphorylase